MPGEKVICMSDVADDSSTFTDAATATGMPRAFSFAWRGRRPDGNARLEMILQVAPDAS
jgi:hypothetical protein